LSNFRLSGSMFSTPVRFKNTNEENHDDRLNNYDRRLFADDDESADNIDREAAGTPRTPVSIVNCKRLVSFPTPSTIIDSPSTTQSSTPINLPVITNSSSPTVTFSKSYVPIPLQKFIIPSNSIGSSWTVEMACLKQSTSFFEAVECLRRVRVLLREVDKSDRIKFCKADYDTAVKALRRMKNVWSDDLFRESVSITNDFFNESAFVNIPRDVLMEIFLWMPINKFAPVLSVCWEWCETGTSDDIWGIYYRRKFLMNNPGMMPSLASDDFMTSFHIRLKDPQIGDKVEVAWRGKFRLETQDVYQGLAWWVAEVVDKHQSQGRYKIRYPGWDSRWDEWVPRSRLRWAVSENTLVSIHVNDVVELWCCGANVPGAWLESKVKKVHGDRYCLGKVLSSGYLWVERSRLRLVRSAAEQLSRDADSLESSRGQGVSLLNSLISITDRFHYSDSNHNNNNQATNINHTRRNPSCSVM